MKTWYTYILECADGTYYCGITTDIQRRLAQHNGELPGGAKYTRGRGPVKLVASAHFPSRASASKAEWEVKRLPKSQKIEHLLQY